MEGKPTGIMPNPLDTREMFFTNLLLLGFEPGAMEAKFRIPFNRDMFVLPNKNGMEAVMHFLFYQLNAQLASEEFRRCWPVRDKTQEQNFRKVCFSWVVRTSEEEPEANLSRVVQSLFHSPGGDRFYSFLLSFSVHVLQKVRLRDHGKGITMIERPKRSPHNQLLTACMSKALRARVAVCRQRFLEKATCAHQVHQQWRNIAIEITKQNRALSKSKREIEREIRLLESSSVTSQQRVATQFTSRSSYHQEVDALKRTQQLQKVRDLWSRLEDFYNGVSQHRKIVNSVLDGEANKYTINASDIQLKVPDLLLRTCERDLQKGSIGNTFVSGKLNLLSLLQLWNLSLALLLERVQQDPVQDFTEHSREMKSHLHVHQAHLANTQGLRHVLKQETITELRDSVEKLRLPLYRQLEQQGLSPKPFSVRHGLGLMQATPPVSFHASETPVSDRVMSFRDTLRHEPPGPVSTPEVVQSWTKKLQKQHSTDDLESTSSSAQPNPGHTHTPTLHGQKMTTTRSQIPQPVQKLIMRSSKVQKSGQKSWKKLKEPNAIGYMSADRLKSKSFSSTTTPSFRPRITSKSASHKKTMTKPRVSQPNKTTWVQQALADEIVSALPVDSCDSSYGGSSCASSVSNTPKIQALADPTSGLDEKAFQPADLIPRTPVVKRYHETTPSQKALQPETCGDKLIDIDSSKPGRLFEAILNETSSASTPDSVRTMLFPPTPSPEEANTSRASFSSVQKQDHLHQNKDISEDNLDSRLDLHLSLRAESPETTAVSSERTLSLKPTSSQALSMKDDKLSDRQLSDKHYPLIPITPLQESFKDTEHYVTDHLKGLQLDSPLSSNSILQNPLIHLSQPVIASSDTDILAVDNETGVKEHHSSSQAPFSPFGGYDAELVGSEGLQTAEISHDIEGILTSEKAHFEGEDLLTLPKLDFNFNFNETTETLRDSNKAEVTKISGSSTTVTQHADRIFSIGITRGNIGVFQDDRANATANSFVGESERTAIPLSPPRQADTSELMCSVNRLKEALKKSPFSSDGVPGSQNFFLEPVPVKSTTLANSQTLDTAGILDRLDDIRKNQQDQQVASESDATGTISPGSDADLATKISLNEPHLTNETVQQSGLSTPFSETNFLPTQGKPNSDEPWCHCKKTFFLDFPSTGKKTRDFSDESDLQDENSSLVLETILPGSEPISPPEQVAKKTPIRRTLEYETGFLTDLRDNCFSTGATTPSDGSNDMPFLVPASPFLTNTNIRQDSNSHQVASGEQELHKSYRASPFSASKPLLPNNSNPVVGQLVDLE